MSATMTFEAKIKPWGNSLGITLPKDAIVERGWKAGDVIEVSLDWKGNGLQELFGTLDLTKKTGKSTMQLLKEARKEMRSKWE
jgi:antitoxin component of MazEF toxin-antitoxin module